MQCLVLFVPVTSMKWKHIVFLCSLSYGIMRWYNIHLICFVFFFFLFFGHISCSVFHWRHSAVPEPASPEHLHRSNSRSFFLWLSGNTSWLTLVLPETVTFYPESPWLTLLLCKETPPQCDTQTALWTRLSGVVIKIWMFLFDFTDLEWIHHQDETQATHTHPRTPTHTHSSFHFPVRYLIK